MQNYKMTAIASGLIASALLIAGTASAQGLNNVYINAGVNRMNYDDAGNVTTLNGKVGTQINKYFGVEAEGGFGIDDDSVHGVEYKQRGNLGGYAVGTAPLSEKFSLIGRLGYHHTWDQAKLDGIKVKDDDGSFAAGVGAQYMFDGANGVRADYTRFTDQKIDNFGVSYVRKF